MTVQRALVGLPFAEGIDTKTDVYQLDPGKLEILENGSFDKLKRIGKRCGYAQLQNDRTMAHGAGLTHFRGETLVSDGAHLHRLLDGVLTDLGGTDLPLSGESRIVSTGQGLTNASVATNFNSLCITWDTSNGSTEGVILDADNVETYRFALPDQRGSKVVWFPASSEFVVLGNHGGTVQFYRIGGASLNQTIGPVALTGNATTPNGVFDVAHNSGLLFATWPSGAVGEQCYVNVTKITSAYACTHYSQAALYTSSVCNQIACTVDAANHLVVAFAQTVTGYDQVKLETMAFTADSTVTSVTAATLIKGNYGGPINGLRTIGIASKGPIDAPVAHIYYGADVGGWSVRHLVVEADYLTVARDEILIFPFALAGQPAVMGSIIVVPVTYQIEGQPTYLLLDGETKKVLRHWRAGEAGQAQAIISRPAAAGSSLSLALPILSGDGVGIEVVGLTIEPQPMHAIELGKSVHFTLGDSVWTYDGRTTSEENYALWPANLVLPYATGTAKTYQYRAVWEWVDANGLTVYSSPSAAVEYKTALPIGEGSGYESVSVGVPRYVLASPREGIKIALYRTVDAGTTFHRVGRVSNSQDPLLDHTTILDQMTDEKLIGSTTFGTSIPAPSAPAVTYLGREMAPPPIAFAELINDQFARIFLGLGASSLPSDAYYWYRLVARTQYGLTTSVGAVVNYDPTTTTSNQPSSAHIVRLTWSPTSAVGNDVLGYRIYRAAGTDNSTLPSDSAFHFLVEVEPSASHYYDLGADTETGEGLPASNSSGSGQFVSGASRLPPPQNIELTVSSGGTIVGELAYRVTALNAAGESLPSPRHVNYGRWVITSFPCAVTVTWDAVTGATSYKIYGRTRTGMSTSEILPYLATVSAPTVLWTDNGSATPGATLPIADSSQNGGSTAALSYKLTSKNATGETTGSVAGTLTIPVAKMPCGVQLAWGAVPGAGIYGVYGRTAGTEAHLLDTGETSWTDTNSLAASGALPSTNTTGPSPYTGGPAIYTAGGVVPNLPPPPTAFLMAHQNRLFGVDGENPLRVWYSHEVSSGYPVEMNPLVLYFDLPPTGGDVVGLGSLDDKLIIFKERCIYWTAGHGPDPTGAGVFSEPVLLTSDVGLRDAGSIALAPAGLMFRSRKGIYLLGRDLSISYSGAPVEDHLSDSVTVRAALLCPLANEVRFYCSWSGLSSTKVLALNYLVGQWGPHTTYAFGTTGAELSPSTGRVETIGPFGQVMREDPSVFTDGTVPYSRLIRTGWIPLGQIQGYGRLHRVLLLGHWLSAHNLTVTLEFDYGSLPQVVTIPAQTYVNPAQYQINPKTHRCSALRVTINESGSGASGSLSALTFVVSLKPGARRLGAGKKFASAEQQPSS